MSKMQSEGKEHSRGEDGHGLSPQEMTMFQLLNRMRTGQLSHGTLKPYSWLDLATQPKPEQQLKIERFFESCSFKSVISYVLGFGIGGAFGLFMSGLDSPITHEKMTTRETLRDMGQKSKSYAKNFGLVGFMFAGTECLMESYSGRSGMQVRIASGCATGGVLGLRAGVQAAALGCAGFAAFSAAIDYFLGW